MFKIFVFTIFFFQRENTFVSTKSKTKIFFESSQKTYLIFIESDKNENFP